MSVISSRTTSIASILKAPGARAQLVGVQKKITFRLPSNIKEILTKLETLNNTTQFEELKNIIKHSQIKVIDSNNLINRSICLIFTFVDHLYKHLFVYFRVMISYNFSTT